MTGCTVRRYEQLETSPETIEQELRPAVSEHRQTDRIKENYSIDLLMCTSSQILTKAEALNSLELKDIIHGVHILSTSHSTSRALNWLVTE